MSVRGVDAHVIRAAVRDQSPRAQALTLRERLRSSRFELGGCGGISSPPAWAASDRTCWLSADGICLWRKGVAGHEHGPGPSCAAAVELLEREYLLATIPVDASVAWYVGRYETESIGPGLNPDLAALRRRELVVDHDVPNDPDPVG